MTDRQTTLLGLLRSTAMRPNNTGLCINVTKYSEYVLDQFQNLINCSLVYDLLTSKISGNLLATFEVILLIKQTSTDQTLSCHTEAEVITKAYDISALHIWLNAVWNLLPDQLRDSDCTVSAFRQSLKTFFFNQY